MEVLTDQPGIQFYSGNFLDGTIKGKGGKVYDQYDGFCLETNIFLTPPTSRDFPRPCFVRRSFQKHHYLPVLDQVGEIELFKSRRDPPELFPDGPSSISVNRNGANSAPNCQVAGHIQRPGRTSCSF